MAKVTGRASKKVKGANAKVSASTIRKAFDQMEYQKALTQMKRQLTIAKKVGAVDRRRVKKKMVKGELKEFKIPKHPTLTTTKRLKKYTEYLKTMIWLQKEEDKIIIADPEPSDLSVIDRLLKYADEVMLGREIIAGVLKNNNNLDAGYGNPFAETNKNFLEEAIDEAIENLGEDKVAKNISHNYEKLKQVVADIILAMYKKETWGGFRGRGHKGSSGGPGELAFANLKITFKDLVEKGRE